MILSKIRIHPFTYVMLLIAVLTGVFKEVGYFMILLLIHESGHILVGWRFRWKIEKVVILPFGGITIFKELLNRPMREEFLITIAGPLFQILGFLFLKSWFFPESMTEQHIALLCFNLLPIVPLDGSKIANIIFNRFFSYRISHMISIGLSIGLVFVLTALSLSYSVLFLGILFFLVLKIIEEGRGHELLVERFQLERFLYPLVFPRYRVIAGDKLCAMYRDCRHLFRIGEKTVTERELLRKKFDFRFKVW